MIASGLYQRNGETHFLQNLQAPHHFVCTDTEKGTSYIAWGLSLKEHPLFPIFTFLFNVNKAQEPSKKRQVFVF